MRELDRSYFIKRASQEFMAAEGATSPAAARIHRELALRYAAMSQQKPELDGPEALHSRQLA